MKHIYDITSNKLSAIFTRAYSTSFSLGIRFLSRSLHDPIYSIYGFVRLADEIVDTFHDYNKEFLFERFREDVDMAISQKISLNPILHSFQTVVNLYNIERELIDAFLYSMEMDLNKKVYNRDDFNRYVLGSAEVVGLMCLRVFCNGKEEEYTRLKPYAMKLGAAYQKINFLRDLRADYEIMGRTYFPDIDMKNFGETEKKKIEEEIQADFHEGKIGIDMLPQSAAFGVYLSYVYYYTLFRKIQKTAAHKLLSERIRISDVRKYCILFRVLLIKK